MLERAVEHVCDGLLAAVGVVGKTCAVWDGEVVEHEEGGEVTEVACSDCATDASAYTLGLFDCFYDFGDCAGGECRGHDGLWFLVL